MRIFPVLPAKNTAEAVSQGATSTAVTNNTSNQLVCLNFTFTSTVNAVASGPSTPGANCFVR
jgi:hypothetical protein